MRRPTLPLLGCLLILSALLLGHAQDSDEPEQKDDIDIPRQPDSMTPQERIDSMFNKPRKPRHKEPSPKFLFTPSGSSLGEKGVPMPPMNPTDMAMDPPPVPGRPKMAPDGLCVTPAVCREACRKETNHAVGQSWRLTPSAPDIDLCHAGCCMRGGRLYKDCSRACWKFVERHLGDRGANYRHCYRGCDIRCRNRYYVIADEKEVCGDKELEVWIAQVVGE